MGKPKHSLSVIGTRPLTLKIKFRNKYRILLFYCLIFKQIKHLKHSTDSVKEFIEMNLTQTSKSSIQQGNMRRWKALKSLPKVQGLMAAQKASWEPQDTTHYIHFWHWSRRGIKQSRTEDNIQLVYLMNQSAHSHYQVLQDRAVTIPQASLGKPKHVTRKCTYLCMWALAVNLHIRYTWGTKTYLPPALPKC